MTAVRRFGLSFRGVAFEFRFRAKRMRSLWDRDLLLGPTVGCVRGAAVP